MMASDATSLLACNDYLSPEDIDDDDDDASSNLDDANNNLNSYSTSTSADQTPPPERFVSEAERRHVHFNTCPERIRGMKRQSKELEPGFGRLGPAVPLPLLRTQSSYSSVESFGADSPTPAGTWSSSPRTPNRKQRTPTGAMNIWELSAAIAEHNSPHKNSGENTKPTSEANTQMVTTTDRKSSDFEQSPNSTITTNLALPLAGTSERSLSPDIGLSKKQYQPPPGPPWAPTTASDNAATFDPFESPSSSPFSDDDNHDVDHDQDVTLALEHLEALTAELGMADIPAPDGMEPSLVDGVVSSMVDGMGSSVGSVAGYDPSADFDSDDYSDALLAALLGSPGQNGDNEDDELMQPTPHAHSAPPTTASAAVSRFGLTGAASPSAPLALQSHEPPPPQLPEQAANPPPPQPQQQQEKQKQAVQMTIAASMPMGSVIAPGATFTVQHHSGQGHPAGMTCVHASYAMSAPVAGSSIAVAVPLQMAGVQIHSRNATARKEWSSFEDEVIRDGVAKFGCRWRRIAALLPGRSDDAVRNRWNRLTDGSANGASDAGSEGGAAATNATAGTTPAVRSRPPSAGAGNDSGSNAPAKEKQERASWTRIEDAIIVNSVHEFGPKWYLIAQRLPGRTEHAIRNRYHRLQAIIEGQQQTAQAQALQMQQAFQHPVQ